MKKIVSYKAGLKSKLISTTDLKTTLSKKPVLPQILPPTFQYGIWQLCIMKEESVPWTKLDLTK